MDKEPKFMELLTNLEKKYLQFLDGQILQAENILSSRPVMPSVKMEIESILACIKDEFLVCALTREDYAAYATERDKQTDNINKEKDNV